MIINIITNYNVIYNATPIGSPDSDNSMYEDIIINTVIAAKSDQSQVPVQEDPPVFAETAVTDNQLDGIETMNTALSDQYPADVSILPDSVEP